jgi:hypothetical protein
MHVVPVVPTVLWIFDLNSSAIFLTRSSVDFFAASHGAHSALNQRAFTALFMQNNESRNAGMQAYASEHTYK